MPEKLANNVPRKLLDLVKSEDTALEVARICFENEIKDEEKIREIGYQTGRVLLGDLSPEKLSEALIEKVKLSAFLANKVAREINDSIFNQVKDSLATLYKEEIAQPGKPKVEPPLEEKTKTPKKVDIYREPIE